MGPRETRERAVRDAKCGLILDAAMRIFREKGYMNARIEDIAAAAGFSKPTLYTYFPDKEAIFLSLAIRELELVVDRMNQLAESAGTFEDHLSGVIRMLLANFSENYAYFVTATSLQDLRKVSADMSRHGELNEEFHAALGRVMVTFQRVVERGKEQGEVRSPLPAQTLAAFVFSLVQGLQMQAWMSGRMSDVEKSVREVMEFVRNGAVTRAAS